MASDETSRSSFFSFPNPVNEVAARCVAAGVALTAALAVVTGQAWAAVPLAYGSGWALSRGGLLGAHENGLGLLRIAGMAWGPGG